MPPTAPATVRRRRLLLAPAGLAMLTGMWAGLARLGWALPGASSGSVRSHGVLMVLGLLGTLVALERAVAFRHAWTYSAPVLAGAGALWLSLGLPARPAALLLTLAGVALTAVEANGWRQQPSLHLGIEVAGAACWAVAAGWWLAGASIPAVVPWLAAFLLLTIVGERVELSRLVAPPAAARAALVVAVAVFLGGVALSGFDRPAGFRVTAVALVALALWLLRYDLARRTVHREGLPRFVAICLLAGFGWMLVAGALWFGVPPGAGLHYDAMLHALFLGFVMSMVFGHAPVILPAVLRVTLPFRRVFYVHVVLLHVSLAVRIAGDLAAVGWLRAAGAVGNVTAILWFVAASVVTVRRAGASQRATVAGRGDPPGTTSLSATTPTTTPTGSPSRAAAGG